LEVSFEKYVEANHKGKEALTSKNEAKAKHPKTPNMRANLTLFKHAMSTQRGASIEH
jgi:hypothetical protein